MLALMNVLSFLGKHLTSICIMSAREVVHDKISYNYLEMRARYRNRT